jgi:hypothetical protein
LKILRKYGLVEAGAEVFVLSKQEMWKFLKTQQVKICDAPKSYWHKSEVTRVSNADIDKLVEKTAGIKVADVEEEIEDFYFIEHNGTVKMTSTTFSANSSNICFICDQSFHSMEYFHRHIECVHKENFEFFVLRERREHW